MCLSNAVGGEEPLLVWKSTGGQSLPAAFRAVRDEAVVLVDEQDITRTVPLQRLSSGSQAQAMQLWLDRQDSEQFRMVRQHLSGLEERPEATSRILQRIHDEIPESPYAGLWAATGYSAGINELTVAKRLVSQTIKRIEDQQKYLPGRHATTLASAYNNLAIILLKDSGSAACAGQLTAASEATPLLAPVIRHNGEQLLNLNLDTSPRFALSTGQRRRLTDAIAMSEVNSTTAELGQGWFYALDVDVPSQRPGGSKRISGLDTPHAALELVTTATGFVAAPGLVISSRDAIESPSQRSTVLLTVGTSQSGQFKTLPVKTCIRTRPSASIIGSSTIRSSWGENILTTRFRFFIPPINSVEAQLVGLHVPGLDLDPLSVVKSPAILKQDLEAVGYQRGPEIIERGLIRTVGQVVSEPLQNGEQTATHPISGGQIGGPLIDSRGVVQGLVFGLPKSVNDAGCRLFGGRVIHSWFNRNVPTSHIADSEMAEEQTTSPDDSIVPIFGWGIRSSMTALGHMDDGLTGSETLFMRDTWCVACGGRGEHRCSDCVDGVQTYRERKQVSYSQLGGAIYGKVTKTKRCKSCSGRGSHDCTACQDGRYSGGF